MQSKLTLQSLQKDVEVRDAHPDSKLEYLQKLVEEIGGLSKAMRTNVRYTDSDDIKGTVEEELYGILYWALALANAYGVDLETVWKLKQPADVAAGQAWQQLTLLPD